MGALLGQGRAKEGMGQRGLSQCAALALGAHHATGGGGGGGAVACAPDGAAQRLQLQLEVLNALQPPAGCAATTS